MTKRLVITAMGLACVCLVWSVSVGMAANPDEPRLGSARGWAKEIRSDG